MSLFRQDVRERRAGGGWPARGAGDPRGLGGRYRRRRPARQRLCLLHGLRHRFPFQLGRVPAPHVLLPYYCRKVKIKEIVL
mgnify:CR=1 FL=1